MQRIGILAEDLVGGCLATVDYSKKAGFPRIAKYIYSVNSCQQKNGRTSSFTVLFFLSFCKTASLSVGCPLRQKWFRPLGYTPRRAGPTDLSERSRVPACVQKREGPLHAVVCKGPLFALSVGRSFIGCVCIPQGSKGRPSSGPRPLLRSGWRGRRFWWWWPSLHDPGCPLPLSAEHRWQFVA